MAATLCAIATPSAVQAQSAVRQDASAARLSPREARLRKRRKETAALARKGEEELRRSVRVFQQRYMIKTKRLELTAGASLGLADAFINTTNVDTSLLFHVNERWAGGVSGFYSFATRSDAFMSIQRDFGLFPERSFLQGGVFAEAQYAPVFGKFSSFGVAVVQLDAYLIGAVGGLRTSVDTTIKPAVQIGAGLRVHTARGLSVSVEARDIVMRESFQSENRLLQHWFIGLRLGLWIPPSFEYKHQR